MSSKLSVRAADCTPRLRVATVAVALAFVACAPCARAQTAASDTLPAVGARVNYRTWKTDASARTTSSRVIGTVVARDDTALTIRAASSNAIVTVARSRLARLDVSTGRHRHTGQGALTGVGAGLLLGTLIGGFTAFAEGLAVDCSKPQARCTSDRSVYIGAAAGTALGAAVGATVGYFVSTEQWVHVVPRRAIGLRIAPRTDGVLVGVRATF